MIYFANVRFEGTNSSDAVPPRVYRQTLPTRLQNKYIESDATKHIATPLFSPALRHN